MPKLDNLEMEGYLKDIFENSFSELSLETGRSINPSMKEFAWQQVLLYWRKLRDIAERITETEVRLILPELRTPMNRRYTILGVVDIIREDNRTIMYDIKTHNEIEVRKNSNIYKGQLNVYAHIWQNLRNSTLDDIAIIATEPPINLREALKAGDSEQLEAEFRKWDPVVFLDFSQEKVEECINSFGETVDKIENGEFAPPPLKKLHERLPGQKASFGTAVCRHCDARYSCDSYYMYINKIEIDEEAIKDIQADDEMEKEEWRDSFLNM